MPKKSKPSQLDINIFREAVKGVKRLIHNKIRLTPAVPTVLIRKQINRPTLQKNEDFNMLESDTLTKVHGDEFIVYKQIGISDKILRKLRKGQYNIEAKLDLHGLTIAEARLTVDDFIQQCLQDRIRVGLIIHGKGLRYNMPILKNKLNHWLRETKAVLAFCSATPRHGCHGAVYVLFKRLKKEESV